MHLLFSIFRPASIRAILLVACLVPAMVQGQGTLQATISGTFSQVLGTGHSTISPGNTFSYVLTFDDSNTAAPSDGRYLIVNSILSAQLYVDENPHPSALPRWVFINADFDDPFFPDGANLGQNTAVNMQNAVSFDQQFSYPSPVGSTAEFSDFFLFNGASGGFFAVLNNSSTANGVQGLISSISVVAVPEPSIWALGGLPLLAMLFMRRRK